MERLRILSSHSSHNNFCLLQHLLLLVPFLLFFNCNCIIYPHLLHQRKTLFAFVCAQLCTLASQKKAITSFIQEVLIHVRGFIVQSEEKQNKTGESKLNGL